MLVLFFVLGCTAPDVGAVELALGAAAPLTFAGVAVAAGEPLPPACEGQVGGTAEAREVEVVVGEACPVPAVAPASGLVRAAGTTADDGTTWGVAADFADTDGVRVADVAAVLVVADGDGFAVTWAGGDVGLVVVGVSLAEVALHTWADRGDPEDPLDDRYTLNGAVQVVSAEVGQASTRQVALLDVVFDAGCGENPVAGQVIQQSVDAGGELAGDELGLGFHGACDGTADVQIAAGTSAAYTGQAIPIELGVLPTG